MLTKVYCVVVAPLKTNSPVIVKERKALALFQRHRKEVVRQQP